MPSAPKPQLEQDRLTGGNTLAFDSLNEPGTYLCHWSGHLLRVPEDAIKPGQSTVLTMTGKEALFVTKISNDPFVALTKARLISADRDLPVNF